MLPNPDSLWHCSHTGWLESRGAFLVVMEDESPR